MALDPNRMTVAEAASLTAAAVVGGGLWFALAGVSGQLPIALGVGWTLHVLLEWFSRAPPDGPPEIRREPTVLTAQFPLQDRLGVLTLLLPTFLSVAWVPLYVPDWLQALGLPSGLVFAAVIVGVGISLALSLTLLGLVTTRIARVEIDLEQRVLTLRRPLRRAVRLHLPEVAKIRSEGGSLLIEHATGVFWQDLRHLAPGELDGIAAELDAAARSGGADPEVRELRTRAKEALAEALPDQP